MSQRRQVVRELTVWFMTVDHKFSRTLRGATRVVVPYDGCVTMGYALGPKCPTSTNFDRHLTPQDTASTGVIPVAHDARNTLGEWTLTVYRVIQPLTLTLF